jgi:predicted nucleotide-binding protein
MSDECSSIETDITAFSSDEDDFSNMHSSYSFGKYKVVYKVNDMNQEDMDSKIDNVSSWFIVNENRLQYNRILKYLPTISK